MANPDHLSVLYQGVTNWNTWRKVNKAIRPDLQNADLSGLNLSKFNLKEARLKEANLTRCDLSQAKLDNAYLRKADLTGANLMQASLAGANLRHAILHKAILTKAYLRRADLSYADLREAVMNESVLEYAKLVDADLDKAVLTNSIIYGASVWNVKGTPKDQSHLLITPQIVKRESQLTASDITVDDLEVAQFIYLLLNNEKVRNVIDTMTSKTVLLLGRFTPERKVVLDAMADELRAYNLLPIIFDFERAKDRDFTETIKILAGLCLFVIADITQPRSVTLELQATVPDYEIPFLPIIQEDEQPIAMFANLSKYNWMLELMTYSTVDILRKVFKKAVIDRAWEKHQELEKRKARVLGMLSADDFLTNS